MPTIQNDLQSDDGTIFVAHLLDDHDFLVLVVLIVVLGHSDFS
jgi:hypothetical protein